MRLTWKYGLHADSTILCALSSWPSTASVTSTKDSSCSSWSKTESILLWWLFQRRQNLCDAIASLLKSVRLPLISANMEGPDGLSLRCCCHCCRRHFVPVSFSAFAHRHHPLRWRSRSLLLVLLLLLLLVFVLFYSSSARDYRVCFTRNLSQKISD